MLRRLSRHWFAGALDLVASTVGNAVYFAVAGQIGVLVSEQNAAAD